jgi:Ca2+/Na+ antiporter
VPAQGSVAIIVPMPTTEIEYELTLDDLFAFQLYAAQHSRTAKRLNRYVYIADAAIILVSAVLFMPWLSYIALAGFLIFVATFLGLGWLLTRFLTRKAIRDHVSQEAPDKGLIGRHRISLDDDGLTESTAVGESRASWAGIDRIERTAEAVLVYTTATTAHVIPRRAFKTRADEDSFVETITAQLAQAAGGLKS